MLGVGGFGVTYLGKHLSLGHRVAEKEYLPNEFTVRGRARVHPKLFSRRFHWLTKWHGLTDWSSHIF